jgi:hypothetical protein
MDGTLGDPEIDVELAILDEAHIRIRSDPKVALSYLDLSASIRVCEYPVSRS